MSRPRTSLLTLAGVLLAVVIALVLFRVEVNDLSLAWGLTIGGIAALCVTLAVAFRIQFLSGRRRTTTGLTKPR